VEDGVDVWRYTILELHARNDDEQESQIIEDTVQEINFKAYATNTADTNNVTGLGAEPRSWWLLYLLVCSIALIISSTRTGSLAVHSTK